MVSNKKEPNQNSSSYKSKRWILPLAFIAMLLILFISLILGAAQIPVKELIKTLFGAETDKQVENIFFLVRLPRSFAAILSGAALAVAGAVLQAVLGNPMCSPSIIGVNAGAALFMIAATAIFPVYAFFAPLAAFCGALVATLVVYFIAKKTGASKITIILAGLAVSGLFSAFTDIIVTLIPDAKISRTDFMIGSFAGVTMDQVLFATVYIFVALIILFLLSTDLTVLSLGDSTAHSLGMRVSFTRGAFMLLAAVLAGSAISLCGLVSFVGLIVPHICKALVGQSSKVLLPLCAVIGGAFCLLCDVLARLLFAPFELPVGIVMSIIGGLFFLYLILNNKRHVRI